MNEELVSIIIPAYNVGKYLEECIHSFFCQTYTNYEIIIIDDGSTDNTYDIGKCLSAENDKVRLLRQENQGVSVARNTGMLNANGEFFIFADADDMVAPQYVETLMLLAQKADMGIVGFTSEKSKLDTKVSMKSEDDSASDMIEDLLCGTQYDGYLWNKIFKRKIIDDYNLEFRKNIAVWEDLLFVLEYLKNSDRIAILHEKLYFYRYREGSAVNNTRIDKYRSKYEVMEEIKNRNLSSTEQSQKKTVYLYFETMFSYLNQILIRENKSHVYSEVLSRVNVRELLMSKNVKLVLKFLYLQVNGWVYKKG